MGAELEIYSIYRRNGDDSYFLLRTVQREYSNVSQDDENAAAAAELHQREQMLDRISGGLGKENLEFIGELQNYPVGEALFSAVGGTTMEIYYIETAFGHPWIVLGTADTVEEFLSELDDDEDLVNLKPVGSPIKIMATLITGNEFPV